MSRKKLSASVGLAVALAMLGSNFAMADVVRAGDDVQKTAGAGGTASFYLSVPDTSDPVGGCNATPSTPVRINVTSNHAKVTIASPGYVQVTDCDTVATIAYSVAADAAVDTVATITGSAPDGTSTSSNGRVHSTGCGKGCTNFVYPSYEDDSFTVTVVAPADPCAGRTAPAAAPTIAETNAATKSTSGWYNATSGTASLTVSPSADAEYRVGSGDWTAYPVAGITLTDAGTHSVTARSILPATSSPECAQLSGPASGSTVVKIDRTAPSASPASVADTAWRNASLSQQFTFSDAGSGLATPNALDEEGKVTLTASAESADPSTPTTVSTTVSDVAGNSVTRSVSALIDLTAPTVTPASVSDTTWRSSSLSQAFAASDALSGLADEADESFTLTASSESADASTQSSASRVVYDAAGNSSTRSVSAMIDLSGPSVSPGNVSNTTWRNTSMSQGFTASDGLSGLADSGDATFTLQASAESSDPSTPTTASKTISDKVGNSTTRTLSALIDLTPPSVTPGDVNNTTWRNTSLSQAFAASDQLSGLDDAADASFTLTASAESAGTLTPTTVSRTVQDEAGNSTTRTVTALIDTTKPVVTVVGPEQGVTYKLGSVPTATCSTDDALSGVKDNATPSVTGGPVGSVTVTCSGATDNAGNSNSTPVTFSVVYDFSGFLAPADAMPTKNTVKAGRAVPIKFKLAGDQGMDIFAPVSSTGVSALASSTTKAPVSWNSTCTSAPNDTVEITLTAGSSSLQYDAATQTYTYIWKTDSDWAGKCRMFSLNLRDGTTQHLSFALLK